MPRRALPFLLFVASGFCSLVYQVVWLRLAFAAFGIVTPVLSVLLSVFMVGLALGSWLAGRLAAPLSRTGLSLAVVYGLAECGIGVGAIAVPWAFGIGEEQLLALGDTSSASYLALSALVIALAILPFATLMGATFPLMLGFLKQRDDGREDGFSFLYLANVIGAMTGALVTALVLVERFGFHGSLLVAAVGNVAIGAVACLLPKLIPSTARTDAAAPRPIAPTPAGSGLSPRLRSGLLFATGFTSMAMEVAWTRAFTPVLQTTIYAFAAVLAVYLCATWIGSWLYRRQLRSGTPMAPATALALLFSASLLPLVLGDPRWFESPVVVLGSIVPISLLLGYLTPQLVDDHARGDADRAGRAYAINVLGCIFGPLLAGYTLLPALGVKWTLLLLAVAYPVFWFAARHTGPRRIALPAIGTALLAVACAYSTTHEDPAIYGGAEVRRDHVATVVSHGKGMERRLFVNGVGITHLTPMTKLMAHLPLALRDEPPQSTLVICFGMGTTFRALSSWGGRTTAVELVPSVRDAFGYYWDDAQQVLHRDGARVVVDDGRRFLKRTREQFDLVTIDPPPPVEAAGSSLLYSVEFYRTLRQRLSPHGVLQQWFPGSADPLIEPAVVNSLAQVFPHLLLFREPGGPGLFTIASDQEITLPTPAVAAARVPAAAAHDMLEWNPEYTVQQVWELVFGKQLTVKALMPQEPRLAITDDRPFNEYFWLRRTFGASPGLLQTLPAAGR